MRALRRYDLPAVTATDLSRRFASIDAVRGVSFEVARGEVFALLGSSGAGKSTILRMLSTLVPPTGGSATVAGYDVVERPRAVQRRAWLVSPGQALMRSRFRLPDVLLMDDPADARCVEAARLRGEGVTIVYSAGTPDKAEQADRVAIVDQGVIVALDSPARLAVDPVAERCATMQRMTERKPPEVSWESWVERKIRESMERGDFDNLPGEGKPIPDLALPYDELWWIRKKLREEQISDLPPALLLRKELDEAMERIAAARTEEEVRHHVGAINERIRYINSHTISGPPSNLVPLDVDRVLETWRSARSAPGG